MEHPDLDDLAMLAATRQSDPGLDAHLVECEQCRADVSTFRRTAELAMLSNFGEDAPGPGDHVWDAIAAELGFPVEARPADEGPAAARPFGDLAGERSADRPRSDAGRRGQPVPGTALASRPRSRRPRWLVPIAALVIGAALGAGALAITQRTAGGPDVEAVAPLAPVPGGPLATGVANAGSAELLATGSEWRVRVAAADLPSITGSYEVWLFGNDGRMVDLGALSRGQGDFAVPQGISTTEYRTVDVSDEPADGNPAHSGISVVRGSFN